MPLLLWKEKLVLELDISTHPVLPRTTTPSTARATAKNDYRIIRTIETANAKQEHPQKMKNKSLDELLAPNRLYLSLCLSHLVSKQTKCQKIQLWDISKETFSFGPNRTAWKPNQKPFQTTKIWQIIFTQYKGPSIGQPHFDPGYLTFAQRTSGRFSRQAAFFHTLCKPQQISRATAKEWLTNR